MKTVQLQVTAVLMQHAWIAREHDSVCYSCTWTLYALYSFIALMQQCHNDILNITYKKDN